MKKPPFDKLLEALDGFYNACDGPCGDCPLYGECGIVCHVIDMIKEKGKDDKN